MQIRTRRGSAEKSFTIASNQKNSGCPCPGLRDSRSLIEAVAVPAVRGTQAVAAIVPAAGVAAEPAGCTVQDVEKKVMV